MIKYLIEKYVVQDNNFSSIIENYPKIEFESYKDCIIFLENYLSSDTFIINAIHGRVNYKNKKVYRTFNYKLINYIYDNIKNFSKINFIILTGDFWIRPPEIYTNYIRKVFKPPSNVNVLTFASEKVISKFHNVSYSSYKNNIHKLLHHTISEKNIQKYNKNPKNQISIFGNYRDDYYPLRNKILIDNPNVIKYKQLPMNIFLATINDSFACFTTSVHPLNYTTKKHESSNCILLKVFEILAGGSLLLYPKDEEQYLNEIGLYDKQNCWLIDMNKNIPEQCSYVTNPNNRSQLEKIRLAGYNHTITNLTQEKLLKPLVDFLEKIN